MQVGLAPLLTVVDSFCALTQWNDRPRADLGLRMPNRCPLPKLGLASPALLDRVSDQCLRTPPVSSSFTAPAASTATCSAQLLAPIMRRSLTGRRARSCSAVSQGGGPDHAPLSHKAAGPIMLRCLTGRRARSCSAVSQGGGPVAIVTAAPSVAGNRPGISWPGWPLALHSRLHRASTQSPRCRRRPDAQRIAQFRPGDLNMVAYAWPGATPTTPCSAWPRPSWTSSACTGPEISSPCPGR
jgi:hypothetical protein